jgi:hypothetical protein
MLKDVGTSPTLGGAESALSVLSLPGGTGSGSVLVPFDLLDQIEPILMNALASVRPSRVAMKSFRFVSD